MISCRPCFFLRVTHTDLSIHASKPPHDTTAMHTKTPATADRQPSARLCGARSVPVPPEQPTIASFLPHVDTVHIVGATCALEMRDAHSREHIIQRVARDVPSRIHIARRRGGGRSGPARRRPRLAAAGAGAPDKTARLGAQKTMRAMRSRIESPAPAARATSASPAPAPVSHRRHV